MVKISSSGTVLMVYFPMFLSIPLLLVLFLNSTGLGEIDLLRICGKNILCQVFKNCKHNYVNVMAARIFTK